MMQKMRKPLALLCALIMCVTMLSGIVLPQLAESAWAVSDAYADVTGTVVDANGLAEGEEGVGDLLYTKPDAGIYFVDSSFSASAGDSFTYTYGGESKGWGNGVSYYLTMGENAFKTFASARDAAAAQANNWAADNSTTVDADGNVTYPETLTGASGSAIIVVAPGYTNSTNSATFNLPTVTTIDAEGVSTEANIEPTVDDLFSLTVLGPQAGKSAVNGDAVGAYTDPDDALKILNNRSVSQTTEFLVRSTLYVHGNVDTVVDGIAFTRSPKVYKNASDTNVAVTLRNCYGADMMDMGVNDKNGMLFGLGSSETTSGSGLYTDATILKVEDCYFDMTPVSVSTGNTSDKNSVIISNDVTFDNCVFTGGKFSAAGTALNNTISLYPTASGYANVAFYGDAATAPEYNVTNCAFVNWESSRLFRLVTDNYSWRSYAPTDGNYSNSASAIQFNLGDNFVYDFGYGDSSYASALVWTNSCDAKVEVASWSANVTNNYVEFSKEFAENKTTDYGLINLRESEHDTTYDITIQDNTFVADYSDDNFVCFDYDYNNDSYMGLVDISGNLYVDHNGNVQAARITNESVSYAAGAGFNVSGDIYASDEFSGGIKELFTVQETTQDLLVVNSRIQAVTTSAQATADGTIRGSVTLFPEADKTYKTKNIFTFKDENVKLLGVYSDEACTKLVSSFAKGFGTLYAKAQYKAGNTTATVVYTIGEPDTYLAVAPTTDTTFTINGDTYTSAYTTLSGALAAAKEPALDDMTDMGDVVVMAPGYYGGTAISKSVGIIGPNFNKPASDGTNADPINGRVAVSSSADATTEVVFSSKNKIYAYNSVYVTLAGVSRKYGDANRALDVISSSTQTSVSHINVINHLDMHKGNQLCIAPASGDAPTENGQSVTSTNPGQTYLYIKGSLFGNKSATEYGSSSTLAPIYINSNYVAFDQCSFNLYENNNDIIYYPQNASSFDVKPLHSGFYVTNSYITDQNASNQYFIYAAIEDEDIAEPMSGYKYGADIVMDNNIIENLNGTPIRATSYADLPNTNFVFTNNYVKNATANTNPLLRTNTTEKHGSDIFSGNVLINRTDLFHIRPSTPTIQMDENYYGDGNGEIVSVPTTCVNGSTTYTFGIKDQFTYYVDPDMTATNKDLALTDDNFASAEITNSTSFADWSMAVTMNVADGKTYTLADFTAEKGEVTEVKKITTETVDEVETEVVTNLFDAEGATYAPADGDVLKATVRYTNDSGFTYTATWTVDVTTTEGAWADYGLAPTADDDHTVEGEDETSETQTYVDLTTQAKYADRDGGNAYHITFVAPDFTKYAHKTYDGAVNGSTDDVFTSVATTGDDNTEDDAGTNVVLDYGDEFYAKMPTTGIVYKLQYAVTACEMQYTNTHHFGTIVLFPGTYTKSNYLFGGVAYYTGAAESSSNFSVGFDASSESDDYPNAPQHLSGCKEYRILGAQAGINAANVSEGTLSSERGSNESIVKGMQVYFLRTGSTGNGAVNIFDGISFTTTSKFSTSAGTGSSDIYNKTNVVTIDVRNCNINTTAATFNLYQNKSTAKANLKVNIRDTYFKNSTSSAYVGKTIASQFHIAGSVIDTSASSAGTVFNIALVSGTANATTITDVSYTCEDSYVALGSGSLFAMDGTATSGLSSSTRTGIEFAVKNNTVASANTLVDITANSAATENANMAAITDIIVTGNTVSGSGDLLAGYGADYGLRKVNVSGNSFSGFATSAAPAFTGFADDVDFTNNYYTSDSKVISANVASGKVTDVALNSDYTAWASDYTITGTDAEFNVALPNVIEWTPAGLDVYGAMAGSTYYATSIGEFAAVDTVKNGFDFASDNVSFVSLTLEDGTEIESFSDVSDVVLKLTAYHKTVKKNLDYYFVVGDVGSRTLLADTAFAGRTYWDPDVSDLADGNKVSRPLDTDGDGVTETIVFTVGTDVFGTVEEIPYTSVSDGADGKTRDIYMFAKTYENADIYCSGKWDRTNNYNFYGVQAGVSAVVDTDEDGIPDAKNPARSTEYETVWNNTEEAFGYQSCATIDGITITGEFFFIDGSGVSTGDSPRVQAQFKLLNCSSDESNPIIISNSTYDNSLIKSHGNMPDYFTIQNNYLIISEESADGAHVIGGTDKDSKQFAGLEVTNNYIRTPEHVLFADVAGGNNLPKESYCPGNEIYNFSNNNLDSSINIGHTATSTGGTVDLTIADNLFDNNGKNLDYYVSVNSTSYTAINSITLSGNTFTVNGGNVNYAIKNTSATAADASVGNVFDGFVYNFGNADHGTVPAIAYVNGTDLPVVLTNGENVATAVIGGVTYAANAVDTTFTESDMAYCGIADIDAKTITDIAQGGVYKFNTGNGMFVKITTTDGSIYYNAVPANGETVVTAQLCSIDGTVTGDEYTATIYGEPFAITIDTTKSTVETVTPPETAEDGSTVNAGSWATYWEANIKSTGSVTATELFGKWEIEVVDYGMYYGMNEEAVALTSIDNYDATSEFAKQYVNDERTAVLADDDGMIIGTKESYANDYSSNGLSRVYLNYSFRMTNVNDGDTRYARMYMTVKVGSAYYTFYSAPHDMTVGATNS